MAQNDRQKQELDCVKRSTCFGLAQGTLFECMNP